jgi:hypothetical protein
LRFEAKTKDRAERQELARWASLAKGPDCRGGKDKSGRSNSIKVVPCAFVAKKIQFKSESI